MALLTLDELGRLFLKFLLLLLLYRSENNIQLITRFKHTLRFVSHLGAADVLFAEILQRPDKLILGSFQLVEKVVFGKV